MLQDIPLGEVSTEIGQEIREENGRLREGRISWQEFETVWTASFQFHCRMSPDPYPHVWRMTDFGGVSAKVDLI
ncbi:hypothetical protein D3875_16830 [Deinococcus cavernae]|uniref:Uncharacterized protein n=2 Tax=Deinococcus cavernae TaxID=2320857 RepID=A0A418VA12_9DEIO|nr:hypothetical protein D3875_16830 [Deinococcus cavernae]